MATRTWSEFVDVSMNLDDTPLPVPCILGEIAQVILSLAISAAQAISETVGKSGGRGQVTIETLHRSADELVEIRVKNNEVGIPEAIRGR